MAKKEGRKKRRLGLAMKILLWAGATAVPLVAFALASAHVARAGGPVWLAATCGAVAFPAGPLAWHGIAAWRRRRARRAQQGAGAEAPPDAKKDAKNDASKTSVLSARDRLLLRIFAVGALVLVVGFGGFWDASWSALRDHGTWFWPDEDVPEAEAEIRDEGDTSGQAGGRRRAGN